MYQLTTQKTAMATAGNTKQKILDTAMRLFNSVGVANVRLQHIADEAGISVGNLAYHYRNKEAIVDALFYQIEQELQGILSTYRVYPNLIDFDQQLSKYYLFGKSYPFYFSDLLQMAQEFDVARKHRDRYIPRMWQQIRKRLDFNVQRGTLKPEMESGLYDQLAESQWLIISFWPVQCELRTPDCNQVLHFKKLVWSQWLPHFTDKGRQEYDLLIQPLITQPG